MYEYLRSYCWLSRLVVKTYPDKLWMWWRKSRSIIIITFLVISSTVGFIGGSDRIGSYRSMFLMLIIQGCLDKEQIKVSAFISSLTYRRHTTCALQSPSIHLCSWLPHTTDRTCDLKPHGVVSQTLLVVIVGFRLPSPAASFLQAAITDATSRYIHNTPSKR